MGMNWLITGGCGFVGTSLVKNLVSEGGHFIRIIDNLTVGTRENLARVSSFTEKNSNALRSDISQSPPVELIVGDILDEDLALQASKGIYIIVHLAASTGVPESVAEPC
jgi:UDP-glucose 4-epimerase